MADRLPPGQGALQNWKNPNPNKPEEYSSEFVIDGKRYANVTNVSTGQRQLYMVTGLLGARGAPITTTNADGTITKGGNYDNFNVDNPGKLAAAEAANKQASVKLLSTPGISTPAEAAAIKNSSQFKSTVAGNNAATVSPASPKGTASKEPPNPDQKAAAKAEADSWKEGTRLTPYGDFVYPSGLKLEVQDVIKFTILKYKPSLSGGATEQTGRIVTLESGTPIVSGSEKMGTITLPIPAGISDINSVGWAMDTLNDIQEAAGKVAGAVMDGDMAKAEGIGKEALGKGTSADARTLVKGYFTNLAGQTGGLAKRAQGATPNNNQELLFGAPSLRSFSFQFTFYPRSAPEATVVRKIIRTFKQAMSVKRSETSLLLKSPHTFAISYMTAGQKAHPFLNRFKECALTSCNVSYTPSGTYMTYGEDKSMTAYGLTLTFGELEPVFDDEYGDTSLSNIGF